MPVDYVDPYTGKKGETCSVSFAAQGQMGAHSTSSAQTEAEFNTSKQLGEWGVITAKLKQGQIPSGTKVLTFENTSTGVRGYLYVKDGTLRQKYFNKGKSLDSNSSSLQGVGYINSTYYQTAIPEATGKKDTAAPTPSSAVSTGSDSAGSMSHEDVAAMFVKVKDDLAKEQGLNIKGANPDLDKLVYAKIGDATGYTPDEVKAKIDAYKADGNKLSALKKKVISGSKKVPEGKAQPTQQTGSNSPLAHPQQKATSADPQPNGVPTVATPKVTDEVKAEVKKVVDAAPTKHYTDEDIAAQYIIAKDKIVAESNGKWTLYSKSDELDALIYGQILSNTGFSKVKAQQSLAAYLGSGKKLSTLKKQLAKQGVFTPKADTLKSGKATPDKDKEKDVHAKADAGYTPTQEKATGDPKTDTGQAPPKAVQKQDNEAGDITSLQASTKKLIFDKFKATGSLSYLSSGPASNYNGLISVQAYAQSFGWGKDLSLLQILRVVDEEGAKKAGVDNGKLFEKQVATWLTTPAGTQHVKGQEAKKAKLLEQEKSKAEAAKLAAQMEANQPALPADSAQFEDWSLAKARRVSDGWLAAQPFTAKQKAGLRHYTGSAYTEMNNYLRGLSQSISDTSKNHIQGAKDGMRPTTEPILVKRGTGANQFSTLGVGRGNTSILWGITGKSFKDEGFLSTSAGGRAAFGGECLLEIECPVGTPMMYVDPFSKHPGENEMLLQAGLTYKVLQVRKEGFKFVVRLRVVDWPGKAK